MTVLRLPAAGRVPQDRVHFVTAPGLWRIEELRRFVFCGKAFCMRNGKYCVIRFLLQTIFQHFLCYYDKNKSVLPIFVSVLQMKHGNRPSTEGGFSA
jgi:hypothetical protein